MYNFDENSELDYGRVFVVRSQPVALAYERSYISIITRKRSVISKLEPIRVRTSWLRTGHIGSAYGIFALK